MNFQIKACVWHVLASDGDEACLTPVIFKVPAILGATQPPRNSPKGHSQHSGGKPTLRRFCYTKNFSTQRGSSGQPEHVHLVFSFFFFVPLVT